MDLSRFHLNSVSSPGSSMPRTEMVEKHHQMKPLIISLPQNVKEPKQVATSQSQRIVSGTQNDRTPPYFRRNYQNYNINSLPRTKDSVGYQEKAKQPLHTPGKVGEQSLVNTPEFQESLYQRERNVHHAHHYSMHPSNDHSLNPPNVENTQHVNYNTNPISEFIHPWNDYRRQESK